MTGFSTVDVEIIFASDLSVAKVLKHVDFWSKNGVHYRIPDYQPTDFASTPPATWGPPLFLIPTGWWAVPVIGHDSAFQNLLLVVNPDGTTRLANLSEQDCNDLLLEMMQAIKPNPTTFERLQMDAIYQGVTQFGWHAYKQDRA